MTPKTKRRLKWVAASYVSGNYVVYRNAVKPDEWIAFQHGNAGWEKTSKTKRQAVAACERHARENPSKK